MLLSLFLLIGNLGGGEILLISILLLGLMLVLIVTGIWRLVRPAKPVIVQHPHSVADELQKLQQLREQGVLSQQEFEEQKRRLLR